MHNYQKKKTRRELNAGEPSGQQLLSKNHDAPSMAQKNICQQST